MSKRYAIAAGQRFGRLVAVSPTTIYGRGGWLVRCDCGVEKAMQTSMLGGRRTSCGCLAADLLRARMTTHGATGSPEHMSWASMLSRCHGASSEKNAAHYRDRGITVCERWRTSFANFLEDMGRRPSGTTLDRVDNDRGYEPGNCRWATPKEQARNRRTSRILEVDGVRRTLAEWSEASGLSQHLIERRINLLGWAVGRAVTEPKRIISTRRAA